jgi:hypothetical protein
MRQDEHLFPFKLPLQETPLSRTVTSNDIVPFLPRVMVKFPVRTTEKGEAEATADTDNVPQMPSGVHISFRTLHRTVCCSLKTSVVQTGHVYGRLQLLASLKTSCANWRAKLHPPVEVTFSAKSVAMIATPGTPTRWRPALYGIAIFTSALQIDSSTRQKCEQTAVASDPCALSVGGSDLVRFRLQRRCLSQSLWRVGGFDSLWFLFVSGAAELRCLPFPLGIIERYCTRRHVY